MVKIVFQEGVYGGGFRKVVEAFEFLEMLGQKTVEGHIHSSLCPGEVGSQRYNHFIRGKKVEMMK